MRNGIGRKCWVIPEGFLPVSSTTATGGAASREALCLLNTSVQDAHVEITVFYEDREPVGPYRLTVPARRTVHVRYSSLTEPEPIARGANYASLVESDVPVVAQSTAFPAQ